MTSSADQPTVLIAATSGRALAAAARRSGFAPLVADLFDDLDTRAVATASMRAPGSLADGFDCHGLLSSLASLAAGRDPIGFVYGSGFEDRPNLLGEIAARHRLLGNAPDIVARIKNPVALAALCARLGIPYPRPVQIADERVASLHKRAGGAGGGHISAARPGQAADRGHYIQPLVEGSPVSALFLADGRHPFLLGFSRQWADPIPAHPFRYGGAVRPALLGKAPALAIANIIARIVAEAGLVGLNSADFLVRARGLDLIEINPRPGATLDIFADIPLFRLHVDACNGLLPPRAPSFTHEAAAAAVVYATRHLAVPAGMNWPHWTADRQPPGAVPAGAPVCTVLAEATEADLAEQLARARAEAILSMFKELA